MRPSRNQVALGATLLLLLLVVGWGVNIARQAPPVGPMPPAEIAVAPSEPPPVEAPPAPEPEPVPAEPSRGTHRPRYQSRKVPRNEASVGTSSAAVSPSPAPTPVASGEESYDFEFNAGIDIAGESLLPVVGFNVLAGRSTTVGLFVSGGKGFIGGGLTASQYFTGSSHGGLVGDLSLALYSVNASNAFRTSTALPLFGAATLGWSGVIGDGFHAGFGLGAGYAHNGNRNIGDIKFNGWMPLLRIRLGQDF